ncbi:OX-2 membrane glycoprotein-like [Thunnus albacares]|uniref:OX-2 membrane glycoprotein-like n=1 Tax=Thunnus albacares TaxID=8236 RepID=UPI001CF6D075|nr:OX-2 membrane glycoprotein-like [Thunnus albacares]
MTNRAVLYFLFMVEVFPKGLTDVIQTQQTVMAKVGEDMCFNCQLMQSRDVLQVTWQKLSPGGKKKNLATYNKYFGQTVNANFQGKVAFKDPGLQNCSIVIREVKEQDEGCYLCLFNTYPEGSLTGRTCLQLYELHEPILQIRESNSTEETVVFCSATGRPAPTVTLNVPQQDLYFSNSTVSVTNTNGTVTVTITAVLSGFHANDTQVGCAARLLSVPEIQVFKMIPAVKRSSADGFDDESGSNKNFTLIVTLITAVAVVCVAVVVTVLLRHKHRNSLSHRDAENNRTPQKPIKNPHECKTPLMKEENEQIRRRTPQEKNPQEEKPEPSHQHTAGSLFIKTIKDPNECKTPSRKQENQQIRQRTSGKRNPKEEKPNFCLQDISKDLFSD